MGRARTEEHGERDEAVQRAEALRRVRQLVRATLRGSGAEVILFGSEARGEARAGSDVDLAVRIDGPGRRRWVCRLREALEESTIPLQVEVVDLDEASPALRREVEREGVRWM